MNHAVEIWKTLQRACVDKKHPWRLVAFVTASPDGPQSRMVVLRAVQPLDNTMLVYTDSRSGKFADIALQPKVSLLFWNPRSNQQLRVWGSAYPLNDDILVNDHWARVPDYSKQEYASLSAPGTIRGSAQAGLDLASARNNFSVLEITATRMEHLILSREGHQRVLYEFIDQQWTPTELIP